MLRNYLIAAYRQIIKNKFLSIINIAGLAVGIAATLLISHYTRYELSYDQSYKNRQNLYRVLYERESENGDLVQFASACPAVGPILKERMPEVTEAGKMYKTKGVLSHKETFLREEGLFYAEPAILDLLSYEVKNQNGSNLLQEPHTMVISESLANKLFGETDPLGKSLELDGKQSFQITGIFKDKTPNHHFTAQAFFSFVTLEQMMGENYFRYQWIYSGFYTYIRTAPDVEKSAIDQQLKSIVDDELGNFMKQYKLRMGYQLQPVKDIHLNSHYMHELEANGNENNIIFLRIIAWFIIIVAWINFLNLFTINALNRSDEINLRLILGSRKRQMTAQFLFESLLVNSMALLVALAIVELVFPAFARLTGLPAGLSIWQFSWFWWKIFFISFVGIVLAGSYPVWGLFTRKVTSSLRGKFSTSRSSKVLKKSLVSFQFFMSFLLLAATLTVFKQLNHLHAQETGFNKDNVLVIKTPSVGNADILQKREAFKEELIKYPFIRHISYSSVIPGKHNMFNRGGIHRVGTDPTDAINCRVTDLDYQYMNVYQNHLISGRNFSRAHPSDKNAIILNQLAAEEIGFSSPEEAVGAAINFDGYVAKVIGVIQNFHQQSPQQAFEPQVFRLARRMEGYFSVLYQGDQFDKLKEQLALQYESFFPGNPMEYFFLEDFYEQQYDNQTRMGSVFAVFSLLSILITFLGVLSLAAYSATERTKEIGIRKTLGARIYDVLRLLSSDYLKLMLLAFILSIPVGYYALNQWLNNFATRTALSAHIFILPLLVVAILTILTVVYQSYRTAIMNPAQSLRYE